MLNVNPLTRAHPSRGVTNLAALSVFQVLSLDLNPALHDELAKSDDALDE